MHHLFGGTGRGGEAEDRRGGEREPRAAPAVAAETLAVRAVRRGDLAEVIAIDAAVTGIEKRSYWHSVLRRYGVAGDAQRQFLVAEAAARWSAS